MTTIERHLAAWAYQNAWANHRLLKATLDHILTVDWMYADAMERALAGREPHPDMAAGV